MSYRPPSLSRIIIGAVIGAALTGVLKSTDLSSLFSTTAPVQSAASAYPPPGPGEKRCLKLDIDGNVVGECAPRRPPCQRIDLAGNVTNICD